MKQKFTCEKCQGSFYTGMTGEESLKDYNAAPWQLNATEIGVLCQKCFRIFQVWHNSLTPEDHEKIRSGFYDKRTD